MRFVLTLVALAAVLLSPVTAAATQMACIQNGPAAMAGMDMPGVLGMDQAGGDKTTSDTCCDHAGHKMNHSGCAQACAASCAVVVALPASLASITPLYTRATVMPPRVISVRPYAPAGPERPPKSIA